MFTTPPKPNRIRTLFEGPEYEEYDRKLKAFREEKKKDAFSAFLDQLFLFKNPKETEKDELALIVRTHLFAEIAINDLINRSMKTPLKLEDWTFYKKIELIESIYSEGHIPACVRRGLKSLNKARNCVAHLNVDAKDGAITAFTNDMYSTAAVNLSGNKEKEKNLETACFRIVEILEWIRLHFINYRIEWHEFPKIEE